ncbi:MAG: hypothetical protein CO071_00020, partial [Gallionellales bacterium CG_4_9_14_0_8_um_filter_59_50]
AAARKVTEENAALQAEIMEVEQSVLQREAQKNEKLRAMLRQTHARLETELLLGKLRRSMRFNRGAQGAFALMLMLAAGLWWLQPSAITQPVSAIHNTVQAAQPRPVSGGLESFKLSTELSHPPLRVAAVE